MVYLLFFTLFLFFLSHFILKDGQLAINCIHFVEGLAIYYTIGQRPENKNYKKLIFSPRRSYNIIRENKLKKRKKNPNNRPKSSTSRTIMNA